MAKSYKGKLCRSYKILKPANQNNLSFMDVKLCIKNIKTCMRMKTSHL